MFIKGIGTDIVRVQRIEQALANNASFAARILTEKELVVFAKHRLQAAFLAKRFAAKEACLKALGTGLAQGIRWHDLETYHTELGQPKLRLFGAAHARAEVLGVTQIELSLSDEADYAIAFVVLS